ncbi:hypothetical protein LQV63_00565 [Paenibacillus profundus]|uniref:Uncharacterized protein n=1 Tax=Paenibacillus profundus TaxID=1173085 RepID=A0ABS8YBU0_9BACL|nr:MULTISPECIES: hypothetical protein [Paenibacillus]MCE5167811.1 hypothetical protein [Paenibacillus profundus]MCM3339702.1 hypothetical protein [Paenibacillus sp. MER TA 81-3]
MMKLQVALFNWLQIHIVSEARPDDHAAKETLHFFADILREDHKLTSFEASLDVEQEQYVITYRCDGELHKQQVEREEAERLWTDIECNPKYSG